MSFKNDVYTTLDLNSGALFSAIDSPILIKKYSDWLNKGDWLSAAKKAGADKIFFIDNNPLIIFADCTADLVEKAKLFNQVWCLARPRFLFLFAPGGLDIYDLAFKPVDIHNEADLEGFQTRALIKGLTQVSDALLHFHRDNLESGKIFGDSRFGVLDNRADKSLIRDLKFVRRELIHIGLAGDKVRFAHALIGRSIFIRYLEDRGILTHEYFTSVARQKAGWTDLLKNPVERAGCDLSETVAYFPRVLADKSFTYALFHKLSRDFNGDMFPDIDSEEMAITQEHLNLIQGMLYGDVGIQQKLFFFSYRFDIIPLDLISSIYEEFYHGFEEDEAKKQKKRQDGAYYTPSVLVEFMLSRIITSEILKNKPRILDPACGSGIFLVEAFRRVVRHEWHRKGEALTFDELKNILKNQICGIEMNPEAATITAFSLYLSMLHYLDPPAIDKQIKMGNKLPNIVASHNKSGNCYHCILPANAFDIERIESNTIWQEKFKPGSFDIVIGNPPWGAPGKNADSETKRNHRILLEWCSCNEKPIGDLEPSQAFLWRGLDFLKANGKADLLVSAGVLFKHNTTTQAFRDNWLKNVSISEVFNFSHVRDFFFKGANSPFLSMLFTRNVDCTYPVSYWTAKQSLLLMNTQAIALSKQDLNILRDKDLSKSTTWKINSWGRVGDDRFIALLQKFPRLSAIVDRRKTGRGLECRPGDKSSDSISCYRICPVDLFTRYDELDKTQFLILPPRISRMGCPSVYSGPRLLVKRGISESAEDKGQIFARFENDPFCFTNAIHGVVLASPEEWKYKVILGVLWSSLARYYFFMTASNWGLWHHEIHLDDELLQLPVILDEKNKNTKSVIRVVDKLREYHPLTKSLFDPDGVSEEQIQSTRLQYERELDNTVYSLYNMSKEQIDLVRDFCEITLPFFYRPITSSGGMPAIVGKDASGVSDYITIFCRCWNAYLGSDEEMRATIHSGAHENLLALEFYPTDKDDPWELLPKTDSWRYIIENVNSALKHPMGTSRIIIENVVHIVSGKGIIVIKRNEKRFWTRSIAREDADATICKRMISTKPINKMSR